MENKTLSDFKPMDSEIEGQNEIPRNRSKFIMTIIQKPIHLMIVFFVFLIAMIEV